MNIIPSTETFLDELVNTITTASSYNKQDQAPPAAVLWPDKDRQWDRLLPLLRERLPVFALGGYSPDECIGPAYWLRCIIARTIPHPSLPSDQIPVLYLPGYGRQDIRAVETCPFELRPLAELQYRGVIWNQKNGRDWTVSAFLQSREGGLGIEVGADQETKEALHRSLLQLASEHIGALRKESPLRAPFLLQLLHPDEVRDVLRWLDDPKEYRGEFSDEDWAAFVALCESRYHFHPDRDGPISAAEKLGLQYGNWAVVWRRFAEAPGTYSAIPNRLREARPEKTLPLLDRIGAWPQDNEAGEMSLRASLVQLSNLDPDAARKAIFELERDHGERRSWIWASLGQAPLASALEHLATMAKAIGNMRKSISIREAMDSYAEEGWKIDLAVLDALACVERQEDVTAVRSGVRTVYRPWLESIVSAFQEVVAHGAPDVYKASTPPEVSEGTCLLFVDGLRFDIAQRLRSKLSQKGIESNMEVGLTALPSVTATAKPATSPAASALQGGADFDTIVQVTEAKVNAVVLRRAVGDEGFQVLGREDFGDPSGRAWSEMGDIDTYGHQHGWKIAHHAIGELRGLENRIASLLDHGWQKVVVVTDHGWLLMPGGLPKAEIPEHLTDLRKGRCARLKEGSETDQQVVPWHWNPTVRVATAPGIHCYEDGKEYEHGGLSPQECVVPILTATRPSPQVIVSLDSITWRGLRCNVVVSGPTAGAIVDIRTKASDPSATLVMGGKEIVTGEQVSLPVQDETCEGRAAFVVVIDPNGALLAQKMTAVGGGL